MPIFREIIDEDYKILIWKYDENEQFNPHFILDKETLKNIKNLHPKRQKEILITRVMLRMFLPKHQLLYKESKEPYLNPSDQYISISHSFPFAVIAISKNKIGIDLEKIQPKLQILKNKFLYITEYDWIKSSQELEYLTAIWAIKESLYKIDSSKYWSFREHYEIDSFCLNQSSHQNIKCRVFDETKNNEYLAKLEKIEDFYLAITKK